jgi:hypothetical protein
MSSAFSVAGLADLPPGLELAAALSRIDPGQVVGEQRVTLPRAEARMRAHQEARYLSALVEVSRAVPGSARRLPRGAEWAPGEVAAALALTALAADRELHLAEMTVTELPLVHTAMWAGAVDRARAFVFADLLEDLTPAQRAVICTAVVPIAAALTTGQLRARLQRLVKEIDPAWAERRYQRALRERRVVGYLAADGTVTITASGLPAGEAAAAGERLDSLARRIQRAGHPGGIDPLRADLLLGLTDGSLHHLHDSEIIELFLGRARTDALDDAATGDHTEEPSKPRPGADTACEPEPRAADHADRAGRAGPADQADPADQAGPADQADQAGRAQRPGAGHTARTGVEIRVGLATLLGLDERCGEIPGLGPVLPDVARGLVADQRRGAQWRFAVTDADGHLIFAGVTRRRPDGSMPRRGACQGGVVELHVSVHVLGQLAAAPATAGAWAPVVADLATQYADRHRVLARLDASPGARFASAALARHIEVRDRTCSFPGCRGSSYTADKDHTNPHANGGLTTRCNIGPLCRRHHRYKSLGWWRLSQPSPGEFCWTSPLGRLYRTRGDPINPPSTPPCPRPPSPNAVPEQPLRHSRPMLTHPPPAAPAAVSRSESDEPPPF